MPPPSKRDRKTPATGTGHSATPRGRRVPGGSSRGHQPEEIYTGTYGLEGRGTINFPSGPEECHLRKIEVNRDASCGRVRLATLMDKLAPLFGLPSVGNFNMAIDGVSYIIYRAPGGISLLPKCGEKLLRSKSTINAVRRIFLFRMCMGMPATNVTYNTAVIGGKVYAVGHETDFDKTYGLETPGIFMEDAQRWFGDNFATIVSEIAADVLKRVGSYENICEQVFNCLSDDLAESACINNGTNFVNCLRLFADTDAFSRIVIRRLSPTNVRQIGASNPTALRELWESASSYYDRMTRVPEIVTSPVVAPPLVLAEEVEIVVPEVESYHRAVAVVEVRVRDGGVPEIVTTSPVTETVTQLVEAIVGEVVDFPPVECETVAPLQSVGVESGIAVEEVQSVEVVRMVPVILPPGVVVTPPVTTQHGGKSNTATTPTGVLPPRGVVGSPVTKTRTRVGNPMSSNGGVTPRGTPSTAPTVATSHRGKCSTHGGPVSPSPIVGTLRDHLLSLALHPTHVDYVIVVSVVLNPQLGIEPLWKYRRKCTSG